MSGREISRIDWLIVTITTPRVARQRTVHLSVDLSAATTSPV
jgi:hypothetical protein